MAKKKRTTKKTTKGKDLLDQVIQLTGVPAKAIQRELKSILEKKKIDIDNLTIDQLRMVVACYLREIMGGLLERSSRRTERMH